MITSLILCPQCNWPRCSSTSICKTTGSWTKSTTRTCYGATSGTSRIGRCIWGLMWCTSAICRQTGRWSATRAAPRKTRRPAAARRAPPRARPSRRPRDWGTSKDRELKEMMEREKRERQERWQREQREIEPDEPDSPDHYDDEFEEDLDPLSPQKA